MDKKKFNCVNNLLVSLSILIKTLHFSRHILHQHWYTCPIVLSVRRNPQNRSLFDSCLSHFRTSVSTSSSSAKRLPTSCEPLYATNTSHRKQETFLCIYRFHWVLLSTKKPHNWTLSFSSIHLKHGRHFDYWKCACASATYTIMKLDCAAT
jgi:hypothetical protein